MNENSWFQIIHILGFIGSAQTVIPSHMKSKSICIVFYFAWENNKNKNIILKFIGNFFSLSAFWS